jgi:hypothetical protein
MSAGHFFNPNHFLRAAALVKSARFHTAKAAY